MPYDQMQLYFEWTIKIIIVCTFFQTIELIQLKSLWAENGIYSQILVTTDSRIFRFLWEFLFSEKVFYFLTLLNLVLLALIFTSGMSWLLFYPFLFTCLVFIRFGGPLNGGSDYMTALVLAVCVLHAIFPYSKEVTQFCIYYLCFQVTISYFIAGLVKLKTRAWRNGTALRLFFIKSNYPIPNLMKKIIQMPGVSLFSGWVVLLFECSFPVIFFYKGKLALIYIGLALLFHLANFFILGLNRFFWAWLSTYPLLYYFSRA